MSEADSSDVGNSPDCGCDGGKASVPDRFSSCAIAKFLNEIRSRTSDGVDLNALEKAEETFDASLQSKAEGMLDGKLQEALEIADDPNEVASLLDSLKNWIERFAQKLRPSAFEGLTTVFRMMSATLSGEYTGFSKSSFVALVGCALYCVSPIDVIPDAIPIFGLVDDAFILGLTLKKIASELETFRRWERLKSARSILACYLPYFNDVKRVILAPGWLSEDDDCSDVIETLRPVYPNAAFERFSWLSNKPWQDARDYIDGQGARDLLNFVREGGDMATVALVGHSLGARLVVRALARLAEESPKIDEFRDRRGRPGSEIGDRRRQRAPVQFLQSRRPRLELCLPHRGTEDAARSVGQFGASRQLLRLRAFGPRGILAQRGRERRVYPVAPSVEDAYFQILARRMRGGRTSGIRPARVRSLRAVLPGIGRLAR